MVKVQTCGFATIFHEIFFGSSKKNKSSKPGGDFFASSPHQGLFDVKIGNIGYWRTRNMLCSIMAISGIFGTYWMRQILT